MRPQAPALGVPLGNVTSVEPQAEFEPLLRKHGLVQTPAGAYEFCTQVIGTEQFDVVMLKEMIHFVSLWGPPPPALHFVDPLARVLPGCRKPGVGGRARGRGRAGGRGGWARGVGNCLVSDQILCQIQPGRHECSRSSRVLALA